MRSNIHAGGRVEPCEVTAAERAIVADMAPRLASDGLVFVGLDFIGGKLTEVNVTSPTGIQELSRHREPRRGRGRHPMGGTPRARVETVDREPGARAVSV